MGLLYPFGKDTERARLKRESSQLHSNRYMADVYRNGSLYQKLSLQERYIPFRLRFLHPKLDNELYNVLEVMLRIPWDPDDYQTLVEENMIVDICDLHDIFTGNENAGVIDVTYGDIVIYFAEFLAYHAEMSIATACEMLLKNLGLGLPVDNEQDIIDACNNFGKSDEFPDQVTMFDQEMYDFNSSFRVSDTHYAIPSWLEQADYYLGILIPAY